MQMMLTPHQIMDGNQRFRDEWVAAAVQRHFPQGQSVLDIGAGTCPYKSLFTGHRYMAHDFGEYTGVKLGGGTDYGDINIKSDIVAIPLEAGSQDNTICTEVLEHVPDPVAAVKEMARLVRPGGKIIITTPFTSGLHQEPYHFYAGFSTHWFHHVAGLFGLDVVELESNGGFFKLMAQELSRLSVYLKAMEQQGVRSDVANVEQVLGVLSNELLGFDQRFEVPEFTIGYHVVLQKRA
jgi:SAM-dependent methyltransferase